jgi:hypothetical protein
LNCQLLLLPPPLLLPLLCVWLLLVRACVC